MPDKPVHLRTLLDSAFPVTCVKCERSLKETKLFNFHWIFKKGGQKGGSNKPPEPPLDPQLHWKVNKQNYAVETFFFLKIYNMIMYDVNTYQYDHYNTCQMSSLPML